MPAYQPPNLERLIPILYEDNHLLAVGKPAGIRVASEPKDQGWSLMKLLQHHPARARSSSECLRLVHPMGTAESGIVLFTKSTELHTAMAELMREGKVSAVYAAVVEGQPKSRGSAPLGKRSTPDLKGKSRIAQITSLARSDTHALLTVAVPADKRVDVRGLFQSRFTPIVGDHRGEQDTGERYAGRCFLHRRAVNFVHPSTGRRIAIDYPTPPSFAAFVADREVLEDALIVALNARLELLSEEHTNAYRLLCGASDGVPGLVAERLGPVAVLWTDPEQFTGGPSAISKAARFYHRVIGLSAVYHKTSVKQRRPSTEGSEIVTRRVSGEAAAGDVFIRESGMSFLVRPEEGYAAGLFLDQRDNRCRVREWAGGRRVLNTFAYTCGFSVAAAIGNAAETVSVDLSAKHLDWGRRNFEANGITGNEHMFIRSEVFDYFARARRQGRLFDLIILDPPTFARSKKPKRVFSIREDLESLIRDSLTLLAPEGILLVNTNARTLSPRFLRERLTSAAAAAKRRHWIRSTPSLPLDFATDPFHSKSLWANFDKKCGRSIPAC